MCGIAGYVGPAEIPNERVERALALLAHRGPDHGDSRRFRTPDGRNVLLVHRRLNIIDLDPRANQPMRVGQSWIAYNGELYNYIERRAALEREGHRFTTESDTEVLLADYAVHGAGALRDCEGMWAFAIYDERTAELLLSRDRFGEKPLYLLREPDGGIYFGSEVKALAELSGRRLRPSERQILRYLVNGYKSLWKTGETFFDEITELEPGSTLVVGEGGRERVERYWPVPRPSPDGLGYEESVAGVRERLIRAVEIRLRADVPLAFCMSGGVDSLSLISIAKRVFDYDVHGFTIVNEDERYEERDMVDLAVRELGLRHTSIPIDTAGFLEKLRVLVRQHDGPVATITYVAHWLLMQSIAEHGYRISVSGTAADELFSGYYDHHLAYLHEVRGDPELASRSIAAWRANVEPIVRNPFLKDPGYFTADPSRREHIYLDAEEFAATLTVPFEEGFDERDYSEDLLRNRMLNELFHESVPVILHEDDHNAMSFSIENRSPFLDRPLFEFANTIPTAHLIREGRAKAVLRDAMRGIVPDPVIDNPRKVGFNAPILDFLDVEDPVVRGALLEDSPIFDYVRRERIEDLLGLEFLPNSKSKYLFNFLNAKMFLEEFGG